MKAIILGGKGFVGSAIARALTQSGGQVQIFGSAEINLCEKSSIEHLKKIITSETALIFASAKAPVKNPRMLEENLSMSANVMEAIAEKSPSYLLYISSDAVFADSDSPLTEQSIRAPESLHGVMHLARELCFETITNFPVGILRPTLVYGQNDPHNGYGPNRFLRLAQKNEDIVLFGKGEERRDHVWVEDVGNVGAAMVKAKTKGAINIMSGEVISFHAIAEKILRHTNSNSKIIETPRVGAMPHNGYRPFDISKLKNTFPELTPVSFEEGLRRVVGKN